MIVTCRTLRLGLLVVAMSLPAVPARCQMTPLVESEPYDLVYIKGIPQPVKVAPIAMPKRQPMEFTDPKQKLIVTLLDRPGRRYQIAAGNVQRVRLFEELLLEEAAARVAEGKFDEAHRNYRFLVRRDAQFPGLAEAIQDALFREAQQQQAAGQHARALGLLDELFTRRADYPGLAEALGNSVGVLVAGDFESGKVEAARELLAQLAAKFPNHPLVLEKQQELRAKAEAALDAARKAEAQGDLRQAHEFASQAVGWWPNLAEASTFWKDVHARYPILVVGVTGWPAAPPLPYVPDWATLRQSRLVMRRLFEPDGYTADGLTWRPVLAQLARDKNGVQLTIDQHVVWPDAPREPAAYDLAWQLLAAAQPNSPWFQPGWQRVLQRVDPAGPRAVRLELVGPVPRLEPWLQLRLIPWARACGTQTGFGLGAFRRVAESAADVRFVADEARWAYQAGQPREIVERLFSSADSALRQLKDGALVAVDRVPPWEVDRYRQIEGIVVERYATPTVHLLIPNLRHAPLRDALVRRALRAGIDRQRILAELLGDIKSENGALLAGPFPSVPAGREAPAAVPYDPRLMLLLRDQALPEDGKSAARVGIRLTYPPGEVAERAANSIADGWRLGGSGFDVALAPWSSETSAEWDVLYVDWLAMEPAVDVEKLLAAAGWQDEMHPGLAAMLGQLAGAASQEELSAALGRIQAMLVDDALVIPLWQLNEWTAYRSELAGVGSAPLTLYQHVEAWRHSVRVANSHP